MAIARIQDRRAPACEICRHALLQVPCARCGGNGVVRRRLLLHQECPACHGVRWWFRCANGNEHFRTAMERR